MLTKLLKLISESEVLIFIATLLFSLLINPYLENITGTLYDSSTKATFTSFIIISLILVVFCVLFVRYLRRHENYFSTLNTIRNIESSGLEATFASIPEEQIIREIRSASDQLIIVNTWTSMAFQITRELEMLYEKNQNLKTTIYLLSPRSSLSKTRSLESNLEGPTATGKKTIESLNNFRPLIRKFGNKVNVKIYDAIPPIALFVIDDKIFYTTLLQGTTCHKLPWLYFKYKKLNSDYAEEPTAQAIFKHLEGLDLYSIQATESSITELEMFIGQVNDHAS